MKGKLWKLLGVISLFGFPKSVERLPMGTTIGRLVALEKRSTIIWKNVVGKANHVLDTIIFYNF